ncbi:UNVERIFIED_CONTAM: Subtilisin-like protease SBT1.7 [Sesamum radiatum]|uniref:Subtilisin-like protease SBT1.7 n=1 Tax=Sesamum radiatum TaxID=300843 RepID=A0AAW2L1I6_SESRA
MGLSSILIACLSFLILHSTLSLSNKESDSEIYIVHVESPPGVSANYEELESWYHSFLSGSKSGSDRDPRMVYTYKNVFKGFAARLSPDDVKVIQEYDGFVHARPQRKLSLHTTHSPDFLGLHQDFGFWKDSNYGEGVIIGVIDTGIFPGHPSFRDEGMAPPPAKWKGKCEFNFTACNKKLIGARHFTIGNGTPFDEDGHGTHTASTAAGNFVPGANFFGQANGTAVGIAPRAHLAIYKVCSVDCSESDTLAAMDIAIDDGVDVLSLSLGWPSGPFAFDGVALGAFSAIQKGIFVSCSAANDGPSYGTLSNEAPWILTVGASTIDRKLNATLVLGDGEEIDGDAFFQPKDFPSTQFPLVYPGNSVGSCDPGSLNNTNVRGKIVLCDIVERTSPVDQARAVTVAGGAAIILVNSEAAGLIVSIMEPVPLPSTQIIVAAFSSRGPSIVSPGILKPDIIGPGVNILAAWPSSIEGNTDTKFTFNMISGTSMSCPHLSGVAALLRSVHPGWSPAAIKSAIMTTADVVNLAHNCIEDQTLQPADIFATGAGHVNPSRANDPGLVYDIQPQDYIPYLCGLHYSDREVAIITQQKVNCSEVTSIHQSQLNYPSFSILFGPRVQTYTRTLTNVAEGNSSYVVQIVPPEGVHVTVEPSKLDFMEQNQKITYAVTFSLLSSAANSLNFTQGYLVWTSAKYSVRSQIVAIMLN